MLTAGISQILSLSISPNHPSLPTRLLNYIECPYKADIDKFLLVAQNRHGHMYGSIVRPCFSSKSSAYFVCLTLMLFEMACKCPHSWCFVGRCFQDLFKILSNILVWLVLIYFFSRYVLFLVLSWYSERMADSEGKQFRHLKS